jgi:hypothetical protein
VWQESAISRTRWTTPASTPSTRRSKRSWPRACSRLLDRLERKGRKVRAESLATAAREAKKGGDRIAALQAQHEWARKQLEGIREDRLDWVYQLGPGVFVISAIAGFAAWPAQ